MKFQALLKPNGCDTVLCIVQKSIQNYAATSIQRDKVKEGGILCRKFISRGANRRRHTKKKAKQNTNQNLLRPVTLSHPQEYGIASTYLSIHSAWGRGKIWHRSHTTVSDNFFEIEINVLIGVLGFRKI